MANVLNNLSYGDSSVIQFLDDGTFVFRPKHNASVAGIEVVGYMQFDQQAAPAVAPSGSARLYFDTSSQTIQQSIAGGGFANLVGSVTSITQGGGTVSVSAAGAITATVAAAQALTLNGAVSSSIVMSTAGSITLTGASANATITIGTTGQITLTGGGPQTLTLTAAGAITASPLAGQALTLNGGGAGTNQLLIGTDGTVSLTASAGKAITLTADTGATLVMTTAGGCTVSVNNFTVTLSSGAVNLNGVSSSSIAISAAGAITLTPASGQLSTVTNFTPGVGTAWWVLPGGLGAGVVAVSPQTFVAAANQVRVVKVYIPTSISVTKISFQISTASAGNFVSIALYSTDGNTKIIDTGAVSTTATGIQTITITATLVPAGFYFFAFTADNTVQALEACTLEPTTGGTLVLGLLNASAVQMGRGANASAAGVMPATLGALTAVNSAGGFNWPIVVLQ